MAEIGQGKASTNKTASTIKEALDATSMMTRCNSSKMDRGVEVARMVAVGEAAIMAIEEVATTELKGSLYPSSLTFN